MEGDIIPPQEKKEKAPRLPTVAEFAVRLAVFGLRGRKAEANEVLPPVPQEPKASDIARHGRVNWDQIRSQYKMSALPYVLHQLAESMMKPGADISPQGKNIFSLMNDISIDNKWQVFYNGNHRTLALKLLGPEFVKKSGMDKWIKIWKKEDFPEIIQ